MNRDIKKIDDNKLETVTGGGFITPDNGGICPINGKYCRHCMIDPINGTCLKANVGIGHTLTEHHLNPDGTETINGGEAYTFYICDYINDRE